MTPLLEAIYRCAMEHRKSNYLQDSRFEAAQAQKMVDSAMEKLTAAGAATADCAQCLTSGYAELYSIHQEAAFLTGLSIGLELSRL